jgi:hypothetical protein
VLFKRLVTRAQADRLEDSRCVSRVGASGIESKADSKWGHPMSARSLGLGTVPTIVYTTAYTHGGGYGATRYTNHGVLN